MQTFLPYPDFRESLRVLDPVRLRNQRRETLSLLTSLWRQSGWIRHPACRMWRGHEYALAQYGWLNSLEVRRRGWQDTCAPKFEFWISRSEEHTSELQSHHDIVCRLLLEKKKREGRGGCGLMKWYVRGVSVVGCGE